MQQSLDLAYNFKYKKKPLKMSGFFYFKFLEFNIYTKNNLIK